MKLPMLCRTLSIQLRWPRRRNRRQPRLPSTNGSRDSRACPARRPGRFQLRHSSPPSQRNNSSSSSRPARILQPNMPRHRRDSTADGPTVGRPNSPRQISRPVMTRATMLPLRLRRHPTRKMVISIKRANFQRRPTRTANISALTLMQLLLRRPQIRLSTMPRPQSPRPTLLRALRRRTRPTHFFSRFSRNRPLSTPRRTSPVRRNSCSSRTWCSHSEPPRSRPSLPASPRPSRRQ